MKEIQLPGKAKIMLNFQLILSHAHYYALLIILSGIFEKR